MIKAIIFDLDDTLYPELEYIWSGFGAVAKRLAQPGVSVDEIFKMLCARFEQGPRDRVFNAVLNQLGESDDPQVIAELVGMYRCHRPDLQLDASIDEMLGELRKKFKLGLITDGFLPAQRLKTEALELPKHMDHIIYTEELGREFWKPNIKAFEKISNALGCFADECVYVANNPSKDFLAPNKLDWMTIQVKCDGQIHKNKPPSPGGKAQIVIDDVRKVADAIKVVSCEG